MSGTGPSGAGLKLLARTHPMSSTQEAIASFMSSASPYANDVQISQALHAQYVRRIVTADLELSIWSFRLNLLDDLRQHAPCEQVRDAEANDRQGNLAAAFENDLVVDRQ